jgi:prepilin-type processing-associated H-X9-DG protein
MEDQSKPPERHSTSSPRWGCGAIACGLGILAIGFIGLQILDAMNTRGHAYAYRRSRCVQNLKAIGIALQTYHDLYKSFPPAFVADKHGVPMHSWRVLLLPHFEDERLVALHDQYKFDEPWNGPSNRKLLDETPPEYRCFSDEENESESNYLAVVGSETLWPGTGTMSMRMTTDGTSKTFAVVECSLSGINWLEPRDVTMHDATLGVNKVQTRPAIRSRHPGGTNVLFSDGSVHYISDDISADTLRGLLTAAGGEKVEIPY